MDQISIDINKMAPSKASSGEYNYTVAPRVSKFDVPIAEFEAAHPEFDHFVVGGFVFTDRDMSTPPRSASAKAKANSSSKTHLMLLLQRAASDSHGGRWDFPGGSVESTDASLLDGVAREVFEETGFHVSHFEDFVHTNKWEKLYRDGRLRRSAKFSFLVHVHEATNDNWEDSVKLAPDEHSAWTWVTREEIEKSVQMYAKGTVHDAPYAFVGVQCETAGMAWSVYENSLRVVRVSSDMDNPDSKTSNVEPPEH